MSTLKPSAEELTGARFSKSSYSGGGGNECVEIAAIRDWKCVRDSKLDDSPTLVVTTTAFAQALTALGAGLL
ncbi:DUF397 domain-containing protein [Streptomyces sp. NPDC014861]|uniref:DUF397 domain-containing protein n=1 Tax=Streptomyces sp. NPDC014861 TaxID=3364923 RepID=UPI003701FFE8